MSKRKKKRAARRVAFRASRPETLEQKVVLSADPLLGGGLLSMHGFQDEPVLTQHGLGGGFQEEPVLTQHGLGGLLNNDLVESTPVHDPFADFWLDTNLDTEQELGDRIEQSLANAHDQTGQSQVVDNYGFNGSGQTVVVIDSGIAWSHTALGEGYGNGYKVVGGWDFTENDADPYDDGTEGSHGTHVAGIIGSTDSTHSGVASGVDLIGLRVFDDAGNGYFSWVEQALDWVYDHRNDFANEITAVNLSLGTSWNADSAPSWAMLEEEFAALEAEGIFISVSAGNSFTDYNTPGVSYPAASDHVIPVMSVDDNGQLSYFSQRATYAIAAPGRGIISTVPDYAAGDADTIDDDWASFSGTSMAAPYVAGASVLVREAMEFVGMTDIDQWDIYNHMMSTGDQFFDSATSETYTRLNLQSAIDALMPTDDYGSSVATAHNLGTLVDSPAQPLSLMSGVISTLTDGDYFTFTAGSTGTATFTASNLTHDLDVEWAGWGAAGVEGGGGLPYEMDVVAGESYTVAITTGDGLGYYDLAYDLEASFAFVDWGAGAIQETRAGLNVTGEQWFQIDTAHAGIFTVESLPNLGSANVAIYDSNMTLISGAASTRADATVTLGQEIYIQVTGTSTDLDLRLTNAVSVAGASVTVTGTSADDSIGFTAGSSVHTVELNGVSYSFDATASTAFNLSGGGGSDSATLQGSSADETVNTTFSTSTLSSETYSVVLSEVSTLHFFGNGGYDFATLNGTAGNDLLRAYGDRAIMEGAGYFHRVIGFDRVDGVSSLGSDRAEMYGSDGIDTVRTYSDRTVMEGVGYMNRALGFSWVDAYSSAGNDVAFLYDTAGDETVRAYGDRTIMEGLGFFNRVFGFGQVDAHSSGGSDLASMYDTAGDDITRAYSDRVVMQGANYLNRAIGFNRVDAYSSTGNDLASMYDTAGSDLFRAYSDRVVMQGTGYLNRAIGFSRADAYSTGGGDLASFYDTPNDDLLRAYSDRVVMQGDGFLNRAIGFARSDAYSSGGNDVAQMYDTTGYDLMRAYSDRVVLEGAGYLNRSFGFGRTIGYSSGGGDRAMLFGSANDEAFFGWDYLSRMNGNGFSTDASGFEHVEASGGGGNDTALIIGTDGDEAFVASGSDAGLTGAGYDINASDFDAVEVRGEGGDNSSSISAIDYALTLVDSWV